ncbi:MAG TPA: hypothetical protein VNM68_03910 [Candidatus Polarisedimenticolia bacterium]|nr:hypothetical protein [Candidatus Polarisedimenticolia bacterium]
MASAPVAVEPIAYAVKGDLLSRRIIEQAPMARAGKTGYCVVSRSLSGMMKEALVSPLGGGRAWRMLSDEGPYLNGTDLAPFPLAFFATGLHFSFLEQLVKRARTMDIAIDSLECAQDTWYTMTGSALRGDMMGGAKPAEIALRIRTGAKPEAVAAVILEAERSSPAHAAMRQVLSNTFALRLNGAEIPVSGIRASEACEVKDPVEAFSSIVSDEAPALPQPIISKVSEAKKVHGVEGGVASSLKAEQRRTLQVHTEGRLLAGGLLEAQIQVLSPIGSRFRFVGEVEPAAGEEYVAPPSLAYLSAGVAFCFMTQLGRYAHIVKCPVRSYRVVQFSAFENARESQAAGAEPMDTHLFLEGDLQAEAALKCLRMSEQTCFLHAGMRGSYPTQLSAERNGQPLPLQ